MVRILHVLGGLGLGGAESRIMDLYRHMDLERVQFDFLLHMDPGEYRRALADGTEPENYRKKQHYDEEVISLGGHIYALPRFTGTNLSEYTKAIEAFFEKHHDFKFVQGHMTSTASLYLPVARRYGIACAAHTRNAGVDKGIKGLAVKYLRRSLPDKADWLFACSHLAGDETFGKAPYIYIPNTIDTSKFIYDESESESVRETYGIPRDAVVIGNVARFSPQKNQAFLIRAFAEMEPVYKPGTEEEAPVYLMLCGEGVLKAECEKLAADLGISDRVIFTGNQSKVWMYYSAMDIFAFPSIYEGLPGVVVEAQASGLDCIMSDKITKDVLITDNIRTCPIDEGTGIWSGELTKAVKKVLALRTGDPDAYGKMREAAAEAVKDAGFDVNDQAGRMMKFYLDPCDANLPGAYRPRVLMIGPDRSVHGGISGVVNELFEAGLDRKADLTYIGTMKEGSKVTKLMVAAGAYLRFGRCLKSADIVHVNAASDSSFLRKSLFIKKAHRSGKKLIIHQHGGDIANWYADSDAKRKKFITDTLNMADLIIVLTPYGESVIKGMDGVKAPIEIMPNAVRIMHRTIDPEAKNNKSMLFLGRICRDKGICELMDAMGEVIAEYPDVKLYLGGIMEDKDLAEVINRYPGNVSYIGWVEKEEKDKYLTECGIYVLPSYYEGHPVSVIEAQAYGCLVVASDVGGIPMTVKDGETGYLVSPRDTEALKQALLKALDEDLSADHERMRMLAHEQAVSDYDVVSYIDKLTGIYMKLKSEK